MGLFSKIGTAVGSFFGGPGGGAIGSLAGGLFDRNEARDESADRREAASLASDTEYQRQKEFAQMGIRWRTADAAAAGLHPLAALGGGGASYSPTVVLPETVKADYSGVGDSVSSALQSMGQNTARAEVATQNPFERELQVLALRRSELQNQLIEGQIAATWASVMGQPGTPPMAAAAGPGVVVSPVRNGPYEAPRALVKIEPSTSVSASRSNAGVEAGASPFSKEHKLGHGLGVRLPSQQASEALEGLGAAGHFAGPLLLGLHAATALMRGPEGGPPHPGLEWSVFRQAWVPKSASKRSYRPSSSFGSWR